LVEGERRGPRLKKAEVSAVVGWEKKMAEYETIREKRQMNNEDA